MSDLNDLSPNALSAAMRGGMEGWGTYGNATGKHIRYNECLPSKSRKRCYCGCKKRATHRGMANGVAMISGCQLSIFRWVKCGV